MTLTRTLVAVAALAGAGGFAFSAMGQEEADPDKIPFNIEEITCWNIATLPQQEANLAMILVYGYNVGARGNNTTTGEHITKTMQATATYCADNPDALLHEVMATR